MKAECRWLGSCDSYFSLHLKPEAKLLEALDLAIDYVDYYRSDHKRACECESCAWWKKARRIRAEMT